MRFICFFFISFFFLSSLYGYELVVIQALSKEKQTFITRNKLATKKSTNEIFVGQDYTFTSDNVSLLAKAIEVTEEFVQWEIKNHFTDVPFQRGDIVTRYDAREYLWTLTPEKIKRRYVKRYVFSPRNSIEAGVSLTRSLSESVTTADAQNVERGGFQFEGLYRKEFTHNYSLAYGLRYAKDVINLPETSIINYRFLGLLEGRYYFEPMEDFYYAQVGLSLGIGFGQSRTENPSQTSFGSALILPSTKISLLIPTENRKYDFEINAAFESLRLEESDASNFDQTTNLTNAKIGFVLRSHL
ncbi:MAG: hypothetical protein QF441_10755 [Bacteriovoracaceae bacterium]|jgi:hypothetical protein|nr:hypothetical protein [Bacteriovoracaceae bacterium]